MAAPIQIPTFEIAGFIPEADSICGERTVLRSTPLGQTLHLRDGGEARLTTDPMFTELVTALSGHVIDCEPLEAAQWLKNALPDATHLKPTTSSERCYVYGLHRPYDLSVKIGGHCLEALVQFDVMSWLHTQLEDSPANHDGFAIRAPEQYALLQTDTGVSVTIMQRVFGKPIRTFGSTPTDAELLTMRHLTQPVRDHLHHLLGEHAGLINDVYQNGHITNIMRDDISSTCTVIDQPHLGSESPAFILTRLRRLIGAEAFQAYYRGTLTSDMLESA